MSSFKSLVNCLFVIVINYLVIYQKDIVNAAAIDKDSVVTTENITSDICSTQECRNAETNIVKNLDPTVDPCKNFYKYVCGNFVKNPDLLKNSSEFDQFTLVMNRVIEQVKKIVEKEIDPTEPNAFQLVKTYYSSCINTSEIETRGLKPLKDLLQILGGWPVVVGNSWKEDNFSWTKMDQTFQSLGHSPKDIFHLYVMKDIQNSTRNILYLSSISSDINKQLMKGLENNVTKAYYNYMVEVAVLLGAEKNRAVDELKEALLFELNLISATEYDEDITLDMIIYNNTIEELQLVHPYLSWVEYLNNVTYPSGKFTKNDEIRIDNPFYLSEVKNLLNNTSKRVIANYMIWKFIADSVDYLNDEIRDKKSLLVTALVGNINQESTEEECIQRMIIRNEGLLVGITAMYVKEYLNEKTRKKVNQMVVNVQKYYDDIFKKIDWLSEESKQSALKKNKLMKRIIGHPDELLDMDIVDKYYENVQIKPNDYFNNVLKLKNFIFQKSIGQLKKSPNETFWVDIISPNIYPQFNSLYNTIVLPASVLQPPFFDESQPNYINYGNLGFIVSHELGHAFYAGQFQLDETGSLREWWTLDDQMKFQEKALCFVNQYNNFTEGLPEDEIGITTIEENIADNQGLKTSFHAYKKWEELNGAEPRLSHLNYTNEQLFFISVASTLCTKQTQEREQLKLSTDEHAPDEIRVQGIMSNADEFVELFNCPVHSPLNPEEKCSIW